MKAWSNRRLQPMSTKPGSLRLLREQRDGACGRPTSITMNGGQVPQGARRDLMTRSRPTAEMLPSAALGAGVNLT